MTENQPAARNVILAYDEVDGAAVQMANPRMAYWEVHTNPADLRGVVTDQWVITAMAAKRLEAAGIHDEVLRALGVSTIHGTPVR